MLNSQQPSRVCVIAVLSKRQVSGVAKASQLGFQWPGLESCLCHALAV